MPNHFLNTFSLHPSRLPMTVCSTCSLTHRLKCQHVVKTVWPEACGKNCSRGTANPTITDFICPTCTINSLIAEWEREAIATKGPSGQGCGKQVWANMDEMKRREVVRIKYRFEGKRMPVWDARTFEELFEELVGLLEASLLRRKRGEPKELEDFGRLSLEDEDEAGGMEVD